MPKRSRARATGAGDEALAHPELALGHLEDCWDEPDPVPRAGRPDLEQLQGAWATVSGRRPAEFLVSGNHVTVHFADGTIYLGCFDLHPAASPKAMDVRIEEGPPPHRGLTALCIYELDGDTLRWCTSGPGQKERPSDFAAPDDAHHLCLVFQREHRNGARPS